MTGTACRRQQKCVDKIGSHKNVQYQCVDGGATVLFVAEAAAPAGGAPQISDLTQPQPNAAVVADAADVPVKQDAGQGAAAADAAYHDIQDHPARAHSVAASPDGRLLHATSSSHSTLSAAMNGGGNDNNDGNGVTALVITSNVLHSCEGSDDIVGTSPMTSPGTPTPTPPKKIIRLGGTVAATTKTAVNSKTKII